MPVSADCHLLLVSFKVSENFQNVKLKMSSVFGGRIKVSVNRAIVSAN